MKTERDLLYGVLAYQSELISREQLAEAYAASRKSEGPDPDAPTAAFEIPAGSDATTVAGLPQDSEQVAGVFLVERGWIDAEARRKLDELVLRKLERHGHDLTATLQATINPDARSVLARAVESDLPGTIDIDLNTANGSRLGPVRIEEIGKASETRDRYTLTRLHAKGGIGQVWLARDDDLGREVALKELRPERKHNQNAYTRFLEEARITGQLEHPSIVPVYEMKRGKDGRVFYTMRFVRGRTLSDEIRAYHKRTTEGTADPLARAALLTSFVSVCQAIAYAHSRGVIHRDLKGQNVVLGDFGEVMVLDWGLAKLVDHPDNAAETGPYSVVDLPQGDEAHAPTVQGQVLGTPAYMAPEQAEGRVDAVNQLTDLYGLGAILYEILTGRAPFTGTDTLDLLRKVREETPPRPRAVDPGIAPALEAVCLRAMAKSPADRYQSAHEVADEVRRWLADEPVSAYPEPFATRARRWVKRHKNTAAAAAFVLVIAAGALGVTSVVVRRERDEARRARDEARGQRAQARRAVNEMYTEVADQWLEDRLDPLQKHFLERSLAYYNDFTKPDPNDPAVDLDRGWAFLRIGDVERKLGRVEQAEAAYQSAIAVFEDLRQAGGRGDEPVRGLATAQAHLSEILAAVGRFERAEELGTKAIAAQRALADATKSPADRLSRARSERGRAELLRSKSREKEGEAAYRAAIKELAALAAEQPGEPAPRQELAAAYDGLGLLLRDQKRADEARDCYRKAVDLLERLAGETPTLPRPRDALSRAYNSLALIVGDLGSPVESEPILRKQIKINERLAEDYPLRPDYRRALARGLLNLAVLERDDARLKDGEANYRRALELLRGLAREHADVLIYQRDLGNCLRDLGELCATTNRRAEAEKLYAESREVLDRLIAEAPDTPLYQSLLAGVVVNQGASAADAGDFKRGEARYLEAIALYDPLVAGHPDNPDFAQGRSKALGNLANMVAAQGRRAEAEVAYEKAARALDAIAAPRPEDLKELAVILSNRGDNLTQGKLPGAEAVLQRAIAINDRLADGFPTRSAYAQGRGVARVNYSDWLSKNQRPGDAERVERAAVEIFAKLIADYPANGDYRGFRAFALRDLAQLRLDAKQPTEARVILAEAAEDARAALKLKPKDPFASGVLTDALTGLSDVLLAISAHGDASRTAEELLRAAPDNAKARVHAARVLARCAPLAEADPKLTPEQRRTLFGVYADRAITLLREAIEHGDPRAKDLLKEPVFEPLKSRRLFQTLPGANVVAA